jgi:hypothetical protein
MRGLAARIKRLEQRARPPSRISNTVARFTTEGQLIGTLPKGPCMVVTDHGTDEEWSASLRAQQIRLIASAGIQEEGQGT